MTEHSWEVLKANQNKNNTQNSFQLVLKEDSVLLVLKIKLEFCVNITKYLLALINVAKYFS